MNKLILSLLAFLFLSFAHAQVIGRVDKKTKEFTVAPDQKLTYSVFGYQYANVTTKKMICFSSHATDVRDNFSNCPLGSYYDTDKLKVGDRIVYLGPIGGFGKMNFIAGSGKTTTFYLPKTCFVVR